MNIFIRNVMWSTWEVGSSTIVKDTLTSCHNLLLCGSLVCLVLSWWTVKYWWLLFLSHYFGNNYSNVDYDNNKRNNFSISNYRNNHTDTQTVLTQIPLHLTAPQNPPGGLGVVPKPPEPPMKAAPEESQNPQVQPPGKLNTHFHQPPFPQAYTAQLCKPCTDQRVRWAVFLHYIFLFFNHIINRENLMLLCEALVLCNGCNSWLFFIFLCFACRISSQLFDFALLVTNCLCNVFFVAKFPLVCLYFHPFDPMTASDKTLWHANPKHFPTSSWASNQPLWYILMDTFYWY